MPSLTYTLGADPTGVVKGTQVASAAVSQFAKDFKASVRVIQQEQERAFERNKMLSKFGLGAQEGAFKQAQQGGRGFRGVGNASLQIQDIAVQMQQGTKASTIMMQQGTQLLSVFGPAGAIAGGLLGIGILAKNTFDSYSESVKDAASNTKKLGVALQDAIASGSQGAIFKNIREGSESIDQMIKAMSNAAEQGKIEKGLGFLSDFTKGNPLFSFVGIGASSLQGGFEKEREEAFKKANEAINEQVKIRREGMESILALQAEENEIEIAKAQGDEETVNRLTRERGLKREIAQIDASELPNLDPELAEKAREQIRHKYRMLEQAETDKQTKEDLAEADEQRIAIIKDTQERADAEKAIEDKKKEDWEKAQKEQFLEQQKLEEKNADERLKRIQAEADEEAKIREEGARAFIIAEQKIKDVLESRLSLEDKIKLAKERVKIAQDEAKRAKGTKDEQMAQAKLADAQGGLMDAREAMIQRIAGGSTSAAEAERQERREKRARARAERIMDKRQAIKDHDARARGEKVPDMVIPNAGAGKDPVKDAIEKGNGILGEIDKAMKALNQKLTVA